MIISWATPTQQFEERRVIASLRPLKSPYVAGLIVLSILLGFAYYDPGTSVFQVHDFLDGTLPLDYLRGQNPGFFDMGAKLPTLLNSLSLNTLAINDLSLEHNSYVWLPPFDAAVFNDILTRIVGYTGMYLLAVRALTSHPNAAAIATITGLHFALIDYWPSVEFTVATQPITYWAVLNIVNRQYLYSSWLIILLSTQIANFVYGGFATVAVLGLLTAWAAWRRREVFRALAAVTLATMLGYGVALLRPLYLVFVTDFVSHREEWPSPRNAWFSPSRLMDFVTVNGDTLINGHYHYGGGLLSSAGLVLLAASCIAIRTTRGTRGRAWLHAFLFGDCWRKGVFMSMVAIVTIVLFYSAEETGVTQFQWLVPMAFQVNRIVVLLPLATSLLLMYGLAFLTATLKTDSTARRVLMVTATITLILGAAVHPGIAGRFSQFYSSETVTMSGYYRQDEYRLLATRLGRDPQDIDVLSLDLDPMIAAFNGYSVYDGYYSAYPVRYKHSFRQVIAGELARLPMERSYFDDWGNRLYLFNAGGSADALRIDWCAARRLGARYVISERDLTGLAQLRVAADAGLLRAYAIRGHCN